MAPSTKELAAQQKVTKAFIAANPVKLTLIPQERVNTGTGAKLVAGTPRSPQTVRIVDQTRTFGQIPGTVLTGDGKQRKVDAQLVGDIDVVIGLYDYWVDADGIRWEVAELLPFNGYERRASVVRYG